MSRHSTTVILGLVIGGIFCDGGEASAGIFDWFHPKKPAPAGAASVSSAGQAARPGSVHRAEAKAISTRELARSRNVDDEVTRGRVDPANYQSPDEEWSSGPSVADVVHLNPFCQAARERRSDRQVRYFRRQLHQTYYPEYPAYCSPSFGYYSTCWGRLSDEGRCPIEVREAPARSMAPTVPASRYPGQGVVAPSPLPPADAGVPVTPAETPAAPAATDPASN